MPTFDSEGVPRMLHSINLTILLCDNQTFKITRLQPILTPTNRNLINITHKQILPRFQIRSTIDQKTRLNIGITVSLQLYCIVD